MMHTRTARKAAKSTKLGSFGDEPGGYEASYTYLQYQSRYNRMVRKS